MNKTVNYLFFILFCFFSCKNKPVIIDEAQSHAEIHAEMDKISAEYDKFDKQLRLLYNEGEKNPQQTILKADSLLRVNDAEKDLYKSRIKKNVASSLNYLKAELYYKLGNYSQSIKEVEKEDYVSSNNAALFAANYAKLKQFDKAKSYVDKIGQGFYIYDYALATYYETVGNKDEALKIYSEIKSNKEIKHYAYYPWAVARYEELNKDNPKLLDEIYFPTENPSFEIADSDDDNRHKIFDIIFALPEAKNKSVLIAESPQTNDKDYYLIKVGKSTGFQPEDFKCEFSFLVYPKDFSLKYYDEKNNKLLTIDEWRNSK